MKQQYKIIGAGGFGKVYQISSENVIKAIYNANDCKDAEIEFKKQEKAYEAIEYVKSRITGVELIDYILPMLKVSRPIRSVDRETKIDGNNYQCYFEMTKLSGIPLSIYREANPTILNSLSSEFIGQKGMDFEIMLHLTTNTDLGGRFYGIKYSKTKISENNPPRGYFTKPDNDDVLNYLREEYGLRLTIDNIKEIIGFIYGVMYFKAKLVPIDIEITLGFTDGEFTINILDFGMCIDLDNISFLRNKDPKISRVINSLNNNDSNVETIIKEEIGMDLYCDLELDEYCLNGWNLAKEMY